MVYSSANLAESCLPLKMEATSHGLSTKKINMRVFNMSGLLQPLKKYGIIILACCLFPFFAGVVHGNSDQQVFQVDRDFYPYYPSLIKWERSSVEFIPPEKCAGCHPEQYEEWTGSVHALAVRDPVYQGELNKAIQAVGHDITRQCKGCHSPVGMMTGEFYEAGITGLSSIAINGVSCDICHSVSGTTHWQTPSHEPENGSLILNPGRDSEFGPVPVKRGPFEPETYCGMGVHECVESPLHLRAELCASCHQVYHFDKHFPFESTYIEWKHGPYAQRNILCQDCHMVSIDVFKQTADNFWKPARSEYKHYFNGANFLLYSLAVKAAELAGEHEKVPLLQKKHDMAVARLKLAAGLEIKPVYQNGRLISFKIRVNNLRAGHNLPTSLTNIRQMWLEVIAEDEKGNRLLESGMLNKEGGLQENSVIFNSEGMGDDFHFAIDPWEVTAFKRHDTIPPRGYRDIQYGFLPPSPETRTITVSVRLRYRQADQKVAESIISMLPQDIDMKKIYGLTALPQLPVVDMAEAEAALLIYK